MEPQEPDQNQPEQDTPAPQEDAAAKQPRRLFRSKDDRVIAGVCGGVAAYFNVDAVLVRVVTVALVALGGMGLLLYLAAWLLVPQEGAGPAERTGAQRAAIIAGAIALVIVGGALVPDGLGWGGVLVPLGWLALAGLVVWWVATGRRPDDDPRAILRRIGLGIGLLVVCALLAVGGAWAGATGGGTVVAAVVIASGVALVAGAFVGGARWLILPALAVALPLALVSASNLDVSGGTGEREYRPADASSLRPSYKLGVGRLVVDLRRTDLPAGDLPLKLDVGVGQALVLVPENVCVAARSSAGVGNLFVMGRESSGIDVDRVDEARAPAGTTRVVLDAHVGVGAVEVGHQEGHWGRGRHQALGNTACSGATA
jgi:phage shock protein PspC (stress-responsive transcriptional regulator)